jgi:hypothetical protein
MRKYEGDVLVTIHDREWRIKLANDVVNVLHGGWSPWPNLTGSGLGVSDLGVMV